MARSSSPSSPMMFSPLPRALTLTHPSWGQGEAPTEGTAGEPDIWQGP